MIFRLLSPATAQTAARIAAAGFALAAALQLLLAAGVVPVAWAWGGSQAMLTPQLRLASIAAAALLGLFAYVIRRRAGLSDPAAPSRFIKAAAWAIGIFMLVNSLGNFASASRMEALLFGPLSLLLALTCLVVAASRSEPD